MRTLTKVSAAAAVATIIGVGAPAAAYADQYTPPLPDGWAETVSACTTVSHHAAAATFDPGAALQLTVTGEGAEPALAQFTAVAMRAEQFQVVATDAGAADIRLTFPQGAAGTYQVSLVEPGTQRSSSGVVTVSGVSSCAAADPPVSTLPLNGTSISAATVWGAGGAIIAGAVALIVTSVLRSRRARRAAASPKPVE
ncbi:hypothetical protein [Gryllotalpicola ginsengisoli]|uniref:hypothetical protein n=1 Tax=Gryllotalpicola ginsengisoli TaxID=444608 RepID=UPI0003B4003F|nr:hypothetical protein [Gryllotalpicola ginsengisoli]